MTFALDQLVTAPKITLRNCIPPLSCLLRQCCSLLVFAAWLLFAGEAKSLLWRVQGVVDRLFYAAVVRTMAVEIHIRCEDFSVHGIDVHRSFRCNVRITSVLLQCYRLRWSAQSIIIIRYRY